MKDTSCRLCGNDNFNQYLKVSVNKKLVYIVRCVNCGLIFQNPMLSDKERLELYAKDYFEHGYLDKENQIGLYEKAAFFLERLLRYRDKGKLLDIGAASGAYVRAAIDKGWEAYGVELSPLAVKFAKNYWKVDLIQGTLEEAHFQNNFFDTVILIHTLEHLPHPLETLEEINRIMKRTGVLYVSLPNIASYKAKKMKEKWESLKPVEHLFFFSPKTLKVLFVRAGFDITRIDTSISIVALEGLQKIGLPVREGLRTFINRYLSVPKSAIRYVLGKILQGEGIEILATPKDLKRVF
jgi:2-polyprenyl-3-methyl-5-hydroxy-6-metoxy-1,4-benzoquinol methylase